MESIKEYTKWAYYDINRVARSGRGLCPAGVVLQADLLSLKPTPGKVYRSISVDSVDEYARSLSRSKSVVFDAFTSCSRKRTIGHGFEGQVKFTIIGKTGRDIARFSQFENEAETLFPAGSKFSVELVKKDGNDLLVALKEI